MRDRSWQIRTVQGVVTVHGDAISIRSTPRELLAGERARWRTGGYRARARTLFRLVGALLLAALFVYSLHELVRSGWDLAAIVQGVFVVPTVYALWRRYLRETTVPLSAIEEVTVDTEERTLTVTYEPVERISLPQPDRQERTFQFPTDDELNEAREILRLRQVPYDLASEGEETETNYRFEARRGGYFCEHCHSQVSPADESCPACGYTLRVEEPVSADEAAA